MPRRPTARELHASTQAQKIIEHTDEVNEEQPAHEYHGRQPKHRQLRTLDTHPQIKVTGHNTDGHRWGEKQATEARDAIFVHFALVGWS